MADIVLNWLKENCPLLLAAFILIAATVVVTRRISKLISRFSHVEMACKEIPEIKSNVHLSSALEYKIDQQTVTVQSLTTSIAQLITFLSTKHSDLSSALFRANSPIQLTETGIEVLEKSGGKKYLEDHLPDLISKMENEAFKSGLDVQNFALSLIMREFSSDDFVTIRNYIFQNPNFTAADGQEIPLGATIVQQVISIMLRDKYFDKHPELKNTDEAP